MGDYDREFVEVRREIVETRNQVIKSDNQVKNLALDIKSFERRFDTLERRTRVAGIGAQVIVAVAIAIAAYLIQTVRVHSAEAEAEKAIAGAAAAKEATEQSAEAGRAKLAAFDQERAKHERATAIAWKLADHLDNRREKEAIDLLEGLDVGSLSPLEIKLLDKRLGDLRTRAAEAAYRAGRAAQTATRPEVAVLEYKKTLALEPDGRYAALTRYLLGTQLWALKHYDTAEPLFREILKKESDKAIVEEVRSLLASSLLGQGKRDEAKVLFTEIAEKGGRYGAYAKEMLAGIQSGAALTDARAPRGLGVVRRPDGAGATAGGTGSAESGSASPSATPSASAPAQPVSAPGGQ